MDARLHGRFLILWPVMLQSMIGARDQRVLNETDMHPGRVRARRSQSVAVTVRAHGPQNMSDVIAESELLTDVLIR
jgi:hypothetical protein